LYTILYGHVAEIPYGCLFYILSWLKYTAYAKSSQLKLGVLTLPRRDNKSAGKIVDRVKPKNKSLSLFYNNERPEHPSVIFKHYFKKIK
jgi:hypothetical protein